MVDLDKVKSQIKIEDEHRKCNHRLKVQKKFKFDKINPYQIPDGYTSFISQILYQCMRGKKSC